MKTQKTLKGRVKTAINGAMAALACSSILLAPVGALMLMLLVGVVGGYIGWRVAR